MRSQTALAVAALTLAACTAAASDAPLGEPDYRKPANSQAKKAFRYAMAADWTGRPHDVGEAPTSDVNAFTYREHHNHNKKRIANRTALRVAGAFQNFRLGECEWQRFGEKNVPRFARHRIQDAPVGAYKCAFQLRYQIAPPHGELYKVDSEGFFFKTGDTFAYAGRFAHPY
ncbi:MAG: hypothetical protein AAFX03_13945 [Pseudomonadota bacterium]